MRRVHPQFARLPDRRDEDGQRALPHDFQKLVLPVFLERGWNIHFFNSLSCDYASG